MNINPIRADITYYIADKSFLKGQDRAGSGSSFFIKMIHRIFQISFSKSVCEDCEVVPQKYFMTFLWLGLYKPNLRRNGHIKETKGSKRCLLKHQHAALFLSLFPP